MNTRNSRAMILLTLCLVGFCIAASCPTTFFLTPAEARPDPPVIPENAKQIAALRAAGLKGDRSAVPALIAALRNPPHPYFVKTGLHSLARLGAVEALPAIDSLIQTSNTTSTSNTNTNIAHYAQAAEARLITEDKISSAPGTVSPVIKLQWFCQQFGETPEQINAAVAAYHKSGGSSDGPQPVEVYALREAADMIYADAKESGLPVQSSGISSLDFQPDYPAALKVRIASLPATVRLATLIEDLAQKKIGGGNEYYEAQLAADEGLPASQTAAAKLLQMEASKVSFARPGLIFLMLVIDGVGDKAQAPVFAHFMAGANVEHMYLDVKNGIPEQIVPGY